MSAVDYTTNPSLAGSSQSTDALGGSDPTEGHLEPQQTTGGQQQGVKRTRGPTKPPAPPKPLLWLCDACERPIRGAGAGFAACDLREAAAAAQGRLRTDDGTPVKARWRTLHARCAPEATKVVNPFFRIWTDHVGNVDDLLDCCAELSRLPWFGHSDWGNSLVKKTLADTGNSGSESDEARAQRARRARRRQQGLPEGDPRHGSPGAYANWGCRCLACSEANTIARQRDRQGVK